MRNQSALIALSDGTILFGESFGASGTTIGELVFNTSMTGYQEILTDPSYCGQIPILTAPHIGNTGCNLEDMESTRIWAEGLVVRASSRISSNYRSKMSLSDFLKKQEVVAISGIDTRRLVLNIQKNGAMGACITTDVASPEKALKKAQEFKGLAGVDLTGKVSRHTIERWDEGCGEWGLRSVPQKYHVVAYDFGVKHQILRILQDKGCHITIVPGNTSHEEVLSLNPDGIFLSNGPGDPAACKNAILATSHFIEKNIPTFGICLGFQIIALALHAKSYKMKFGHHGGNHPVIENFGERRVLITSQNHGFAIEEASLPETVVVTHRSLFDGTLQGFRHSEKPLLAFQGHPEASPGPHDIQGLFDEFIQMMNSN